MMNFPEPEFRDRLVDREEAARLLGVCARSLRNWQSREFGPRPVMVGGAAIYDRAQIEAFAALGEVTA